MAELSNLAIGLVGAVRTLIAVHGLDSALAEAIGNDFKGYLSLALYAVGIAISFVESLAGFALYTLVAVIWFIPDRRIERQLKR